MRAASAARVRPVLDPTEPIATAHLQSWAHCPQAARTFGYAPFHDDLRVGDLVLVAPLRKAASTKLIEWAQSTFYGPDHAGWIHAAIYVGDGEVIEAVDSGVRLHHLGQFVPSHRILIRRGIDLSDKEAYRIALRAYWHRGRFRYSANTIFDLASLAFGFYFNRAKHRHTVPADARRIICSTLYNKCFFYATGRSCVADRAIDYYITPAHLSFTPLLQDAPVRWAQIA